MKVWVYEPGRDDWLEGVFASLEIASRELGLKDPKVEVFEGQRYVQVGSGYLSEFEVEGAD